MSSIVFTRIESERGGKLILVKNYTFRKHRDIINGVSFRCTNKICKARILMDKTESVILEEFNTLNHDVVKNVDRKNPPKYEYGYDIVGEKGGHQGKQEQRDGIYASGRYFVQNKDANTDVQYFADDWGYHPAVEYNSNGPHSRASAKFALGHEAVVQLRNKENNRPQLQGLPDSGPLNKDGANIKSQTLRPLIQPSPQPKLLLPVPSQQIYTQQPTINVDNQPPYDPFQQEALIQKQQEPQQVLIEQQQQQGQVLLQHQPQEQQLLIHPQPQEQQVVVQQQPQEQQLLIQKQPQFEKLIPQQHQQLVIQHIQQPVENVIFPQPTPTPQIYQTQEPQHLDIEQPNLLSIGDQSIQQDVHIQQEQAVAEKLVQSEEQANAVSYQQFGLKIKDRKPSKLIETTQHLVTGQDVLDINGAVSSYEETRIQSTTPYPTVTEYHSTEPSFQNQPIVVADVSDNKIVSTTDNVHLIKEERIVSTTASNFETVSTTFETTSPTPTIVVTPRPVSTTFLAPITAGVRLESTENYDEKYNLNKQNVEIQVQKTVPYYLGKYEYPLELAQNQTIRDQQFRDDLELGKTLLYFPGQVTQQKQISDVDNHITQHLPNQVIHNQFLDVDQQLAQGYQHQVYLQQLPLQENKQITNVIHQPYPVKVPYEVQVPVVKQVAVPVTVEKVVEKPVHITKVIEKPVAVPQPYPVEKIVDRPVHIPVQVTKYIDRPYPVHVQVPVPQPYPVERVVQKIVKQPYPVEIRVPYPVDRIVEKKVSVPQYIDRPVTVEKIVEKPVTQYVDRPYPVHIQVPVDRIIEKKVPVTQYIEKQVPVEKIVDRPVPQYIDRPYPVQVKVPVPQPYYIKVEVPKPYPVQVNKYIEKPSYPYYAVPVYKQQLNYGGVAWQIPYKSTQVQDSQIQSSYNSHVQTNLNSQIQSSYNSNVKGDQTQSQGYFYPNPYSYAPQNNFYLPPKKEIVLNNGYLPPDVKSCDHQAEQSTKKENYIGLLPPKIGHTLNNFLRKYRSARSSFDDKSVKMEYGFMPPLVPSLEIDEYGNPVEKGEK